MKKILFLLMLAVLSTVTLEAQVRSNDTYTISGQVIDSLSNEPLAFATIGISLTQTATQFISAAATDDDGKFVVQLRAPGNYLLTVQSVGYTTLKKPLEVTETNKTMNLGKILVQENVQALGEVTVTAQRPLVKVEIDKLIYNMEEDPDAKVNNTLEMLRKVPMITVDGEDKIQLKGASNFKIFLNGRPSNMLSGQNISDVLKSMPANTIKNIEVITDPGAKYDAEGIGGIINIITTRNVFQGYQGSVGANAGTFGGFGGNTYLTAKIGKFGITGNYSYNNNRRPWGRDESVSENLINPQYHLEKNEGKSKNRGTYMYGNLEASIEFDTLRLLSFGVNLYNGQSKSTSERAIEMFNNTGVQEYSYKTDGNGKSQYGSTGLSLDYQRSTRKKSELITFSYRFSHSPNGSESFTYARDITGEMPLYIRLNQWYDNNARTAEHTGQIDYTTPITPKHTIETGLKYILRLNLSNVSHYELDANKNWVELPSSINSANRDFEHISNIYAGYVGYAFKSAKYGFRTGLRAEGTQQEVKFRLDESKNFDVDYFNMVPSATVSYQLKPSQQLRLGYSLRIYRPSIWYLNPYVNDVDPYNISYGNPNLKPEKSNSFNLNYSFFSQKYTLNASVNYSYVNNSIERYSFIDPAKPEVRQSTYDNIGSRKQATAFLTAGWTPNTKLRFNLNGGLYYVDMHSPELGISRSGVFGMSYFNAQLTLPKDFRINAMVQYQGRFIMLQSQQSEIFFTNMALNKDFLKKKMTVSLSCNSPISKDLIIKSKTTTEFFETNAKYYNPMREVRLSVSYRFGTMKEAIKKVQRGISNDDVKGGSDGGGSTGGGG